MIDRYWSYWRVNDFTFSEIVVEGDAGVGKSTLLQHVIGGATGFRVAQAIGVESEMEIPTFIPTTGWNARHRPDAMNTNVHVSALQRYL
jgi:predicted ATP-dependent serine protease